LGERKLLWRPFTAGLDEAAADNLSHEYLPTNFYTKCWRKFTPCPVTSQGLRG
jgi:hypothetical protein